MTADLSQPEPLVTVIVIFLNGEKFFDAAIQSVLNQTFADWELILVDDGSTDRSSAMARDYARLLPARVSYLEHPGHENRGMSASRNLGVRAARGRYVALLDCDDVWHPEKLARQVPVLERHPDVGLVYSAAWRWYSWTGNPQDRRQDHARPLGVPPGQVVQPPAMIARFLRDEGQTPATCSVLIRREVIEAVGGFEEEFRGLYEDQVFFYKVLLSHSAYIMDGHWDYYRQHADSCCQVASAGAGITTRHPAHGRFLDWFAAVLATDPAPHPEIVAALAEARMPFDHPVRHWIKGVARATRGFARDVLSDDRAKSRAARARLRGQLVDLRRRTVRRLLPSSVHARLLAAFRRAR